MRETNKRKLSAGLVSLVMALAMVVTMMPVSAKAATRKTAENEKLTYTMETVTDEYKGTNDKVIKTISYQYPVFTGESEAVAVLNNFYTAKKDAWIKASKSDLADAEEIVNQSTSGATYGDQVTCKVVTNDGKYLCVMQEGYYYSLGAHGSPYRYSYIFDAATGKQVKPATILNVSVKKVNTTVRNAFIAKYNKTAKDENFPFYKGLKQLKYTLNRTNFNINRVGSHGYYLKNGKIYFYYDPYMVGYYAAGYIQVSIAIN